MAEVTDLLGCKGTKLELCMSETLKDLAKAVEVLLPGGGEDDNIV